MAGMMYSGAAKGAAQGAAFGPWGMAIGAGLGMLQGRQADKELKRQYEEQLKLMKMQNEAVLREQARGIAEINRQRTITNIQTAQALAHYGKQAQGMAGANAAAIAQSDARGTASVMLESEVLRQEAEAKALTKFNLETQHENFNTAVDTLSNQTARQFQDPMQLVGMFQETMDFNDLMSVGMAAYSASKAKPKQQLSGTDFTTSQGYKFSYNNNQNYGFSSGTGKKGLFG